MITSRWPALVFACVITAAGCEERNPLFCQTDEDCADPGRPFCDVDGDTVESGGILNTCVSERGPAPDGGTPDGSIPDARTDGGVSDGGTPADIGAPDSGPDGGPVDTGVSDAGAGDAGADEILTVTFAGAGFGRVESSPAGLDCNSACQANFPSQSLVSLTATPEIDSTFDGWGGACSAMGACDVVMQGPQVVDATFSLVAPPAVPGLIAPENDATVGNVHVVGSLQPTFVWESSTGALEYELQYSDDPAFTASAVMVRQAQTQHQPAADLAVSMVAPVGTTYHWRVRACIGRSCSAWSVIRRLHAGVAVKDFDADGFADVAVGAPRTGGSDNGAVLVWLGGMTLRNNADIIRMGQTQGWRAGIALACGDFNGDGYADLAYGMNGFNERGGVDVYFGSAAGFAATPDREIRFMRSAAPIEFGWTLASPGDVNGDGFSDLLVGEGGIPFDVELMPGYVHVLYGGTTFDGSDETVLSGVASFDRFGRGVGRAGDVNGDGLMDIIAGSPVRPGGGEAYVYFGDPTAPGPTADATLTAPAGSMSFGAKVGPAGDFNRDGYADVLVADPPRSMIHLYLGGPGAFDTQLDGTISIGGGSGNAFGHVGDVDGDGYSDLAVGAPMTSAGTLFFFRGNAALDLGADGQLITGALNGDFGYAIGFPSDVNGDGRHDFIVSGGPTYGTVKVYQGNGSFMPQTSEDLNGISADDFGETVF